MQQGFLGKAPVSSVYFGGGTPSLLSAQELSSIMACLQQTYTILPDAEITLEANPDDLSLKKLEELAQAGINRLSIGIQTFHEEQLAFLNRAHSRQQAMACVADARKAGFRNLSLDLIYAIPSANHSIWQDNLQQIVALAPEHISAYSLTIEPQTVFGRWQQKGKLQPATDDWAAAQFELLTEALDKAGYEQYEVSNFALPGHHSRHNSSYWLAQPYLGLGPSAHSFDGQNRQYNLANNAGYIKALQAGKIPFQQEVLNNADRINDYLLTGLRTKWGCDLDFLKQELNYDVQARHTDYLQQMISNGQAYLEGNRLKLSRKGWLLADEITLHLMAEAASV